MLEHMAHLYTYEGLALLTYRYYYPGYVPGRVILSVHSVQASRGDDIDRFWYEETHTIGTAYTIVRAEWAAHSPSCICGAVSTLWPQLPRSSGSYTSESYSAES